MKKKNGRITMSTMYCCICGNRGIPIQRPPSKPREPGHLKRLYCIYCDKETNHAECRGFGEYTHEDFRIEFENGNFDSEGNRIEPNWKKFIISKRKKAEE